MKWPFVLCGITTFFSIWLWYSDHKIPRCRASAAKVYLSLDTVELSFICTRSKDKMINWFSSNLCTAHEFPVTKLSLSLFNFQKWHDMVPYQGMNYSWIRHTPRSSYVLSLTFKRTRPEIANLWATKCPAKRMIVYWGASKDARRSQKSNSMIRVQSHVECGMRQETCQFPCESQMRR